MLCNLKSIGNSGFGGGLGWFLEAVCSDSWVWRRSGEVWEVGSVAIPGFGGLGWVWEAVCSDSWVWRRSGEEVWGGQGGGSGRSGEEVWGGQGGGSGRPYAAIPGLGGGLGRGPVRRHEATRSDQRNKEARALDQQVGMRIKRSEL